MNYDDLFAKLTDVELHYVGKIIGRAKPMFDKLYGRGEIKPLEIHMDLSAVHKKCPIDFARLSEFSEFDFAHDLLGIYRHLNRETGELENFFIPRCAKPKGKVV